MSARTPQMIEVIRAEVNKENVFYLQKSMKSPEGRRHLIKTLSKFKLVA